MQNSEQKNEDKRRRKEIIISDFQEENKKNKRRAAKRTLFLIYFQLGQKCHSVLLWQWIAMLNGEISYGGRL